MSEIPHNTKKFAHIFHWLSSTDIRECLAWKENLSPFQTLIWRGEEGGVLDEKHNFA